MPILSARLPTRRSYQMRPKAGVMRRSRPTYEVGQAEGYMPGEEVVINRPTKEPRRPVRSGTTMMSRAKLNEVVREIFVRMYEEADPPAQYPREVKSYEDHYLSHDRQKQIVEEVMTEYRVKSQPDRIAIRSTVYTGGVPNTIQRISTSVGS